MSNFDPLKAKHHKLVDPMKTRMWCVYSSTLVDKDKAVELTRQEFKSQLDPLLFIVYEDRIIPWWVRVWCYCEHFGNLMGTP